jgi:hypothetical protein
MIEGRLANRPKELVGQLGKTPEACIDLVNSFSSEYLGLSRIISSDGDFALGHQDGSEFRIRHAGNGKFWVCRKPKDRQRWLGGEEARMSAAEAVADLVSFSRVLEHHG